MSNPNKNKFIPSLVITAGLILPIFLSAFIMMGLIKWMPTEISYSGIMSLIILSIELFLIVGISTGVLSLVGITEQKIDKLGFLGFIISVMTSFIFIIAGYYWMKTLHLTSVQLSSTGILIIAAITMIILVIQVKILEKLE